MSFSIMPEEKRAEFQNAPEGPHSATCVDFVVCGYKIRDTDKGQEERLYVQFAYAIDAHMEDGTPFLAFTSPMTTPLAGKGLSDRAHLYKHLKAWKGGKYLETAQDLDLLVGENAMLSIEHNIVGDKTYANISSIMPPGKKADTITSPTYIRAKDREDFTARKGFTQHPSTNPDGMPF